ncbi:MAG: hypothetical protein N5P05_003058 [Chroococcopsis gigantea SAG 12.99]|jgi:putative membrane protein|nr:phage holin family protein [Chlorogloea purpurea SAG 13.99]MDV3001452.1 hypothetical protein [Chroococcopsis gigantea SAG 12.99]
MLRTGLILLATVLSLLVVDTVVPGVNIANFPAAIVAGLAIGAINATVKPVISTLSLPLNFVTLGGFSLVINGLCFWLAALLVPGFYVHGLIGFFLAPIVLSFANTFLGKYLAEKYPTMYIEPKA